MVLIKPPVTRHCKAAFPAEPQTVVAKPFDTLRPFLLASTPHGTATKNESEESTTCTSREAPESGEERGEEGDCGQGRSQEVAVLFDNLLARWPSG
jgi:hypothetical protein